MIFLRNTSRSITESFFLKYDSIKLRLYLEIAATGDYYKLVIKGNPSPDECFTAWEEIVRRSNEVSGSFQFNHYRQISEAYAMLISDYNTIKACLMKLLFVIDADCIAYLAEKGYAIDTSGRAKYEESLAAASRKSDNIMTKIMTKYKELNAMTEKGSSGASPEYGQIMANLRHDLAPTVIGDDITLAEYDEYQKIIKRKIEAMKKPKFR